MDSNKIEFINLMKARTKNLALRTIKMFRCLPKNEEAKIIGKQVLRSATSVAANYRAVNRARSNAEYLAKLGLVIEEADETLFWFELLVEANIVEAEKMTELIKEATEILSIFATAKKNSKYS